MKKDKLAIVVSGGGMKCAYGVGVLTALAEEFGYPKPSICIASSGGAGIAVYYLSGQYWQTVATFLSLLPQKLFISYRRKKILDVDYLVDELFKKRYPVDFKALKASGTRFLVAATRVTDGETVYLKIPSTKAAYERLRATKAVPFVYGREVRVGKQSYIDGDFGTNTEDLVRKAITEGAKRIVVIESNPLVDASRARKLILTGLYYKNKFSGNKGLSSAILREMQKTVPVLKQSLQIVVISPSKSLSLSPLSRNKLALRKSFNLGYADASNNKELKKLLA